MAQYKVPQDVEADDKLLGPFSFRQFVYLIIDGVMIALAVVLFQVFPLLAIIPVPIILFFAALALPLKKDQPMETYLAAIVTYYLKPRRRVWIPGQRDHAIQITAPKKVEGPRTRDISGEEASHRLSFLADIIDSEGLSIKASSGMSESFIAENSNTQDIFEANNTPNLTSMITREDYQRHTDAVNSMRAAIAEIHPTIDQPVVSRDFGPTSAAAAISAQPTPTAPPAPPAPTLTPPLNPAALATPPDATPPAPSPVIVQPDIEQTTSKKPPKPSIIELANNPDYSIQTIQKEAKRINQKEKDTDEVYISLH